MVENGTPSNIEIMSFINSKKRIGPKWKPWGTPLEPSNPQDD